ncbi:MAG: hypothetical protein UW46_C0001G0096 [Candidatus Yanofskybacteria bacterium GW2011_GWF1_44_227]|uniref:Uncharacterized protein n=1 Tax=Candidatus Yanofskybacteria bacterium GW2011_GWE2_40_11 TaxID=1619033 RepID=A0A0G0TTB6_9BACT|nr:MAG: hypothetical protein UT69_C0013G0026 [Candidatus Yanofskybacteria bacterium GW2011_GWE1_40_10]KKR41122.1 MAG: hypothetical protein UT75_C0001G0026 [Candidatus Yanofskybacteria bacterium GW2011_GWE2_40_11]KKT15881.1 MAG: hypothetical protein UV97_C0001G0054 [Candidatus Yanofskybacteria bacterium GW2011_GWF2_43_596]KKT53606.1 MAG: hypothetical protein UW46_C0001G0096 [Candidatus Yanofskybacteria bacterium GW2011_GWF1_44_227]OGN36267.1 MAG: hypothetical protein A2241_00805 [Candidatus Yano
MDQLNRESFDKLVERISDLKKGKAFDLSSDEDLSIAVMNLVSLEEHFYFTAEKTNKLDYFDMLNEVRGIRKVLLGKMIDEHEGETWCVSKHLLATTMRMIEVGTKYYSDGKKEEAKQMYDHAYRTYSIFWGIRLKLIDMSNVKKVISEAMTDNQGGATKDPESKPWKFEDIVNKLVNCCDE